METNSILMCMPFLHYPRSITPQKIQLFFRTLHFQFYVTVECASNLPLNKKTRKKKKHFSRVAIDASQQKCNPKNYNYSSFFCFEWKYQNIYIFTRFWYDLRMWISIMFFIFELQQQTGNVCLNFCLGTHIIICFSCR